MESNSIQSCWLVGVGVTKDYLPISLAMYSYGMYVPNVIQLI
jgi:hypothetical protein